MPSIRLQDYNDQELDSLLDTVEAERVVRCAAQAKITETNQLDSDLVYTLRNVLKESDRFNTIIKTMRAKGHDVPVITIKDYGMEVDISIYGEVDKK